MHLQWCFWILSIIGNIIIVSSLPSASISLSSAIISSSTLPTIQQDFSNDEIRHVRRKHRVSHKPITDKIHKRRHRHRNATRRYIEKQMLVYNRTLALLGNEVDKILQSTKDTNVTLNNKSTLTTIVTKPSVFNANTSSMDLLPFLKEAMVESFNRQEYEYNLDESDNREQIQARHSLVLERLVQLISNSSGNETEIAQTPCQKWESCKSTLHEIFLGPLPSCPCNYPARIFYEDKIWDTAHKKFFRWKDASSENERLDVYKPGAVYCIRSLLAQDSTTLAAQHCCYDGRQQLITRGSGAGNPNLISPDVSETLHFKIDILPWRICKGDFTRYNRARPPNNGNSCRLNPDDKEFRRQVQLTSFF